MLRSTQNEYCCAEGASTRCGGVVRQAGRKIVETCVVTQMGTRRTLTSPSLMGTDSSRNSHTCQRFKEPSC